MGTWLVVGLGNPGPSYARHRHNVGAMAAHELAKRSSASWKSRRMARADTAQARLSPAGWGFPGADAEKVILATTRTYMNLSGVPTRNLMGEQKIKPAHLIVIHDELDIDLGQIRVKFGGGDNGHNGLKSIRAHCGTGEYFRVRVGIGRPTGRMDVSKWVLTDFHSNERDDLAEMISQAADAVESLILNGLEPTQSQFNS